VSPQSQCPKPGSITKAAKANTAAVKKEEVLKRAVEEFQRTQSLPLAPSQKLFANSLLSKTLSSQEENALNIQRGIHRYPCMSIDLIPGEEVAMGNMDFVKVSEAWSAHDKSAHLSI